MLREVQEKRRKQKLEARESSRLINLEERKKTRLLRKVQALPTNDPLEAARIRFLAADAKEAREKRQQSASSLAEEVTVATEDSKE